MFFWKMTCPLTAGLPSKNFIFGHAHWIPLIEKWGKSLGKNNFPHYLPFQDALSVDVFLNKSSRVPISRPITSDA